MEIVLVVLWMLTLFIEYITKNHIVTLDFYLQFLSFLSSLTLKLNREQFQILGWNQGLIPEQFLDELLRLSESQDVMYDLVVWCEWVLSDTGSSRGLGYYMMAHWVAPQQSLMMATPDLVMDGLLGGISKICLLGFGGSCHKEREKEKKRWSHHGNDLADGVCGLLSSNVVTHFVLLWVFSPEASASVWGTRPSPCPPLAPWV